jgi:hypothetical protein
MKNLTKIFYSPLIILILLTSGGCSDWLDINEDPNNPSDVPLNQILPSIQSDIAGAVGASTGGLTNFTALYMHQCVQRGTSQNDYGFKGDDFGVIIPWTLFYTRALTDIREVLRKGEEEQAWHYVGVAQILKAYIFSVLVDIYGNIPYFDANQGSVNPYPAYDNGEEVYAEIFKLLDEGISNLQKESSLTPLSDDLFYGGGTQALPKWRKFAKTLKLKLYNQARLVWDVSADVKTLLSEDDLIERGDDFEFHYGSNIAPDNRNPAYAQDYTPGGAYNYISPYFFEIMRGINTFFPVEGNPYLGITDPRVPYYFYNQLAPGQEAQNPTSYKNGEFVAIYAFSYNIDPNEGYSQTTSQSVMGLYPIGGRYDDGNGGAANFNGAGDTPQRILTYFQRKYIEAELALTGITSASARDLFEEAIRASFSKVNEVAQSSSVLPISSSEIDAYVNSVLFLYDAADNNGKLRHIMTQKWIASFGFAVDAYTDYRRTGYPVLHDGNTDNLNITVRTKDYPLSFPWITDNLSKNPNAPAQKIITSYRVFWDVN